jgi:hypothetical protein
MRIMEERHHDEELKRYREALLKISIGEQRMVLLILLQRVLEEERSEIVSYGVEPVRFAASS